MNSYLRRGVSIAPLVITMWAGAARAAPAGAPPAAPPPDPVASLCAGLPAPAPSPAGTLPELTIALDGVTTRRRHGVPGSVAFFQPSERARLAGNQMVVRIEAVPSSDPTGAVAVACGYFDPNQALALPVDRLAGNDVWRVRVHLLPHAAKALGLGAPKARPEDSVKEQVKKAKDNEKAHIYWTVSQDQLEGAIAVIEDYQGQPDAAKVPAVQAAAQTIADAMQTERFDADHRDQYQLALADIGSTWPVAADALKDLRADEQEIGARALRLANESDRSRVAERVKSLLVRWQIVFSPYTKAAPARCDAAWTANYAENPELARLWEHGVFELPTTPVEQTIELSGNGMPSPARSIPIDLPVTAWVTSIPVPTGDVYVRWDAGNSTGPDAFKAIGGLLSVVAGRAPTLARVLSGGGPPKAAVAPANPFTAVFAKLTTQKDCTDPPPGLATRSPLAPLAQVESIARTTSALSPEKLLRDRNYTVYACTGPCVVSGTKPTVLAQARAATPAGWGVTLFGALGYDLRLSPSGARFTSFNWRPATPVGATQQVFRLDEVSQPLQSISSSLLLTLLFPETGAGRFGLGAGPSIIYGDGTGPLQQWTANLLYLPSFVKRRVTDKVYLTAGLGFRLYQRPLVYHVGDTLALAVANQQAPTPPVPATKTDAYPVLSLGIALDLSVLGDAASTVFGTKVNPNTPAGAQ